MRAKIAILVSLAGLSCPLCADEIQWRSASPRAARAGSAPSTASAPARPVTLAAPVAVPAQEQASGDPGVTPVSFRPVPVARTRGEEVRYASPLPQGPVIAGAAQGKDTAGNGQGGKPTPKDKQEPIEEIPTAPTPLPPSPNGSGLIIPLDSGVAMTDGTGFGPDFFLSGVNARTWFSASAEYLLWAIQPNDLGGALPDVGANGAGAGPWRSGARLSMLHWFPCHQDFGAEVTGLFLDQRSAFFAGGNLAAVSTNALWSIEGNLRYRWYSGPYFWMDAILGYRHFSVNELLTVRDLGTQGQTRFGTDNTFDGASGGVEANWNFWRAFTLGGHAKVGLGNVTQSLIVPGNNLALSRNSFGVLPDFGMRFGWNLTSNVNLFAGYDVIYLNSSTRLGEVVARQGAPGSGVWAHGFSFGLVYSW